MKKSARVKSGKQGGWGFAGTDVLGGEDTMVWCIVMVEDPTVTIVNQRFCKCVIKCISDTVLTRPYRAVLRKEDVRATEKDRVEMIKCFRPGDIILARVLPMTEVHTYQLTTAENELGVVIAHSESEHSAHKLSTMGKLWDAADVAQVAEALAANQKLCLGTGSIPTWADYLVGFFPRISPIVRLSGAAMVPISWTEMQCPKTYVKEPRKVAKVVPENVNVDSS
ncbi:hypothetical protein ANN_13027 [Periplaneta americana]|uniref:Exosome complex component CSL4 C-terminal domain-containing protein n=1 Tax=Periplaneta americana TaxID=6978 RepID=A0ABQ8TK33_PERAM|nr:hypothetical protein ANN_13027 [Periplaneta americana]